MNKTAKQLRTRRDKTPIQKWFRDHPAASPAKVADLAGFPIPNTDVDTINLRRRYYGILNGSVNPSYAEGLRICKVFSQADPGHRPWQPSDFWDVTETQE